MKKQGVLLSALIILSSVYVLFSADDGDEPEWITLRPFAHENIAKPDWRIHDNYLEFNKKTEDPVSLDTFSEAMEAAQKAHIPFILLGYRTGKGKELFYHFTTAEVLNGNAVWKDPMTGTGDNLEAIEIYVVGDNGVFTTLDIVNKFQQGNINKYVYTKLTAPDDEGYRAVAQLFKNHKLAEPRQYAQQWFEWAEKYKKKTGNKGPMQDLVKSLHSLTLALDDLMWALRK